MQEKPFTYFSLQFLGFLLGFLGFISIKIIPAVLCVGFLIWLDVELESWIGLLIGTVGFLLILCFISFPFGSYIAGLGVDLLDYSHKYKKSFIFLHGTDFKEPTFDEFNLKAEDYYSYNRRFRLNDISAIFIAEMVGGSAFLFKNSFGVESSSNKILMIVTAIVAAILTYYVVKFADNYLDKRLPQHIAVQEYKHAKKIYDSVQNEIRENKFRTSSK
jgi:hypothetical protein